MSRPAPLPPREVVNLDVPTAGPVEVWALVGDRVELVDVMPDPAAAAAVIARRCAGRPAIALRGDTVLRVSETCGPSLRARLVGLVRAARALDAADHGAPAAAPDASTGSPRARSSTEPAPALVPEATPLRAEVAPAAPAWPVPALVEPESAARRPGLRSRRARPSVDQALDEVRALAGIVARLGGVGSAAAIADLVEELGPSRALRALRGAR